MEEPASGLFPVETTCALGFRFLVKWERSIFPDSKFPLRKDTRPWVYPPCNSSVFPLSTPNSSPWCGINSHAVLLPSDTFFQFIFLFCCGDCSLFAGCLFSQISLFPLSVCFCFSAQKNLTSIPKKIKLQKLKFKKNLKKTKKYSTILSALLTFSIVSCDLCLVLCSIDDEHLIMNVLVYSDKEKKPKKRSEFNSVYNKNFKNDPHSTQNRMGTFPLSFCDNAHHSCISF